MVSEQASSLASLLMDRGGQKRELQQREEGRDAVWRQPETRASGDMADPRPDAVRIQQRLAKALQHEQFSHKLAQIEAQHASSTVQLLKQMEVLAGKRLSRFHERDYSTQVRDQRASAQHAAAMPYGPRASC
jgi:hypothetical protein